MPLIKPPLHNTEEEVPSLEKMYDRIKAIAEMAPIPCEYCGHPNHPLNKTRPCCGKVPLAGGDI